MVSSEFKNISIGVSSCLLGHNVRYDGQNKRDDRVLALCEKFTCIAICPEYAIGLGIPREPINIIKTKTGYRVRGTTNSVDVTDQLIDYANHIHESMPEICGYIFKARSPSCGFGSTPGFDLDGREMGFTDGIFAARIKQLLPDLPMVEETQLADESNAREFADAVLAYAESRGAVS